MSPNRYILVVILVVYLALAAIDEIIHARIKPSTHRVVVTRACPKYNTAISAQLEEIGSSITKCSQDLARYWGRPMANT